MRPLYVLIFVAAVFLSSIDSSTATTATSINSRRLVFAEQDKTDGKQFLRAEVKDEDDDDEEDRGIRSRVGAITKVANKAQTSVTSFTQKLSFKQVQALSDKYFRLNFLVWHGMEIPLMDEWIQSVRNVNSVNPEKTMLNTLTKDFPKGTVARRIQQHKDKNKDLEGEYKYFTKMQTLHFSMLKNSVKGETSFRAMLRTSDIVGDSAKLDPPMIDAYLAFLKAPRS